MPQYKEAVLDKGLAISKLGNPDFPSQYVINHMIDSMAFTIPVEGIYLKPYRK